VLAIQERTAGRFVGQGRQKGGQLRSLGDKGQRGAGAKSASEDAAMQENACKKEITAATAAGTAANLVTTGQKRNCRPSLARTARKKKSLTMEIKKLGREYWALTGEDGGTTRQMRLRRTIKQRIN